MLPLGVIIPTKNSMAYLPGHAEGLRPWLDLAREVVIVDSQSTDGSVEFLQSHLAHPNLRVAQHPPGLYASWNHGVRQIEAEYVYFATTGDSITRPGIETLVRVANECEADVVISKPIFKDLTGQTVPAPDWPIDDIIRSLKIERPTPLSTEQAILFTTLHASGAMLGSSASDLFRTDILKRMPFPTEYGTAGDGIWGCRYAAAVSWAVVPDQFSTFLVHPSQAPPADQKSIDPLQPINVLDRAGIHWVVNRYFSEDELEMIRWDELLSHVEDYLAMKWVFDQKRRGAVPWIFNPAAWQTRIRRQQLARQLTKLKWEILRSLDRKI